MLKACNAAMCVADVRWRGITVVPIIAEEVCIRDICYCGSKGDAGEHGGLMYLYLVCRSIGCLQLRDCMTNTHSMHVHECNINCAQQDKDANDQRHVTQLQVVVYNRPDQPSTFASRPEVSSQTSTPVCRTPASIQAHKAAVCQAESSQH